MKKFLNIIFYPFRVLRVFMINQLLKLRARLQMATMRDAIKAADKIHKETGKKVLVIYNNATKAWEPIEKQLLKLAHKKLKKVNANAKRKRGKEDLDAAGGMTLNRVKVIEKKSVYAT